jgi:hypothetical protein
MGEEFYCVLKLVSGEEIFSLIMIDENDGDPIIVLQNPVVIKILHNNRSQYVKIKPWMELSNDDFFMIKLDKVITMTESNDEKLIDVYQNYLMMDDDGISSMESGMIKPSKKMGYLSSVKDARKRLERLFKDLQVDSTDDL